MQIRFFLFMILIIKALSKTTHYYTDCDYGAPKSGFITYSECQEYSDVDSYCCLLYYVANPDLAINLVFKKGDTTEKEVKGRKLSERVNLCFGLTSSGYDNIEDVIEELQDESGIEEIHINCSSKSLNYCIFLLILFIIF